MATNFLSKSQRQQLNHFPERIEREELIQFFTLSASDLSIAPKKSAAHTHMGFVLSFCALRFLGFIPESLSSAPDSARKFLAKQIKREVSRDALEQYGTRKQTKSDHALLIERHLGFQRITDEYHNQLKAWLLDRAMEHDRPTLLLKTATEKLKRDKIVRPSLIKLERLVGSVRDQARQKTYQLLSGLLSEECKASLDNLLLPDKDKGYTPLTWLRQRATSHAPKSILNTLKKIAFLQEAGVAHWDLSMLNANRLKILNRLGKCSTNQALQRSIPEKRYPILTAFMHQALEELIDEAVDLFDQCLRQSYSRSKHSLKKHHEKTRETTNEKVRLLKVVGSIILNKEVPDPKLRETLYGQVSYDKLRAAIDECDTLMRPENDKYFDYFAKRFSHLRQFTPKFLQQLEFQSLQDYHPTLQAIELLKKINQNDARKIPDDAPTDFVSNAWKPYIFQKGNIDRKYYELCTLWALRNVLRSGDVWVNGGRRYNNPEHYLIPRSQWPKMKKASCELLQVPSIARTRIEERQKNIDELFTQLNKQIVHDHKLKIEEGNLIITPLEAANEADSLKELRQHITDRLPKVDLPEIMIEVDKWVNFSVCFHHAGNQTLDSKEFPIYLYAALLSEATNVGPMAAITDLDYERIVWHKHWLIRDETLNPARIKCVNFQHNQAISTAFW